MNKPKPKRKTRALNISKRYQKEIRDLAESGLKPAQIVEHFNGKFTYWQVYNTINPRPAKLSDTNINEQGEIEEVEADSIVTDLPEVDLSSFTSIEKFFEHSVAVIIAQLNSKRISLKERTALVEKLQKISLKNKTAQIEHYLKNANARLTIRVMRRCALLPSTNLSDEEILKIYKEEAEILRKETKK
ncbi:MAG: hypothetical protein IPM56_16195 [Ignavibacteriales bacterium]|nr:MAG: hypothetical protein IPM56_16195 [Ignavibacteriales bacterium]